MRNLLPLARSKAPVQQAFTEANWTEGHAHERGRKMGVLHQSVTMDSVRSTIEVIKSEDLSNQSDVLLVLGLVSRDLEGKYVPKARYVKAARPFTGRGRREDIRELDARKGLEDIDVLGERNLRNGRVLNVGHEARTDEGSKRLIRDKEIQVAHIGLEPGQDDWSAAEDHKPRTEMTRQRRASAIKQLVQETHCGLAKRMSE